MFEVKGRQNMVSEICLVSINNIAFPFIYMLLSNIAYIMLIKHREFDICGHSHFSKFVYFSGCFG